MAETDETCTLESPGNKKKRGISSLVNFLNVGSTIAWLLIVLTTFIDVVVRYVFSKSIPGGYEIIKVLMAVGIFLSLPIAALNNSQVRVELLVQNLSKKWQTVSKLLGSIIGSLFFGVITWKLLSLCLHAHETREVTTYLRLPLWWVMVVMVIFGSITTICCLVSGRSLFNDIRKGK